MEALSTKTEREKLAELEAMLADASLSQDSTGEGKYSIARLQTLPAFRLTLR